MDPVLFNFMFDTHLIEIRFSNLAFCSIFVLIAFNYYLFKRKFFSNALINIKGIIKFSFLIFFPFFFILSLTIGILREYTIFQTIIYAFVVSFSSAMFSMFIYYCGYKTDLLMQNKITNRKEFLRYSLFPIGLIVFEHPLIGIVPLFFSIMKGILFTELSGIYLLSYVVYEEIFLLIISTSSLVFFGYIYYWKKYFLHMRTKNNQINNNLV